MRKKKFREIVLTGGPCSGKTTGINYLSEKLRDWGWRVFIVPEVATMFILGGVPDISDIAAKDTKLYYKIQKQILLTQRALRQKFTDLADEFDDEKMVIIYDRAEMDGKAYVPAERFDAFLEEENLELRYVRDNHDGVIFLVTAAKGAESFFTLANNKARRESLEEARTADDKTLAAWNGHPHIKIVDNSTDFEGKMKRCLQGMARILGVPVPLEIERKFLLKRLPDFKNFPVPVEKIYIEQMYLVSPDHENVRIRRRSQNGSSVYYKTTKNKISPRVRHETESAISAGDYLDLSALKDPETNVLEKFRYCFPYNNQYFELDWIYSPETHYLLEIELTEENDKIELPPFLEIDREVTEEKKYSNHEISKRKTPA